MISSGGYDVYLDWDGMGPVAATGTLARDTGAVDYHDLLQSEQELTAVPRPRTSSTLIRNMQPPQISHPSHQKSSNEQKLKYETF